jgi:endonuclease III
VNTIDNVYRIVKEEFSKHSMPVVELIQQQTKDPFKVLITTILSARTKDETTANASKRLFSIIHNFSDLKKTSQSTIQRLIYPVGFYKIKARYLKQLPSAIEKKFNNQIPSTVDELVMLPGVGRKTANLVVAVAFDKPAICVDVHVHRICNRLGYIATKSPFETEMALREILPLAYWKTFNSFLVSFGQNTCRPINPLCNACPLMKICKRVNVTTKFSPEDPDRHTVTPRLQRLSNCKG